GIASISFRLWHQTKGIYYIDNIVLSNANGNVEPPVDPADPPLAPEEPIVTDGIPNNSLEQMYNDSPIAWHKGGWGDNHTSFEYLNSGHTGNHSVKITITNFVNGDAKWYFDPVLVDPTKQYVFSNYYQSDTNSDIIAELKDASGNISYLFLTTLNASTDWFKTSVQFEVPAGTASITIFHLITSNGFLITDDYSLKIADIPPEDPKDPFENLIIPNNDLEEMTDTNNPTDWSTDKWGENSAAFEYLNTGYNSNHSVKTTISTYLSGDAKWFFAHQNITPEQTYRFSDYYQSDIPSQVIVEVIKNDGNYEYLNLKIADASTVWKQYIDTFSVPIGAVQISIFHLIAGVGFLITDNYSLTPYQTTSLEQPIISLTFDDGWEDNYFTALPILDEYGFKSTQYYATTFIENNIEEANLKITKFIEDGHEIGSHSVSHPDFKTLTDEQLQLELMKSKETLETFAGIGKVQSFATPYGSYDARIITAILEYYQSHRSTDTGFNTKDGLNIANIKVQNMTNTTTLAEYSSWVNKAIVDKAWLVIIYHKIVENPGIYDTYLSDFTPQMDIVKNSGITVLTVSDALAAISPQLIA
ncbi:MAG: polysaccharide deacetylase family protein, partial [Patescibacteria group bacterium]